MKMTEETKANDVRVNSLQLTNKSKRVRILIVTCIFKMNKWLRFTLAFPKSGIHF
jgi:hypothetical protein